jgi:hypothetical protein
MSRVLAKPGIGAFARITIDTGLVFDGGMTVVLRESPRNGAKEIRQGQPPHQEGWFSLNLIVDNTSLGWNSASQRGRNGQINANPPEARQFQTRMTPIEAGDQTQEIDFNALDPTEL